MKKLIVLMLSLILLLAGCSDPAASKSSSKDGTDNSQTHTDPPSSGGISSDSGTLNSDDAPDKGDMSADTLPPVSDTTGGMSGAASDAASPSDIPVPVSLDDCLAADHADSSQVILVTVKTEDATAAIVKTLEKVNGAWSTDIMTIGYVGENGSAEGSERIQDSLKTPLGIYRITSAMGLSADPGTDFDYTQITENMYWDLNSGSDTYNRLVYSDPGGEREELFQMGKQYDYILTTSYNEEQTENKGGAIFIHVSNNEPTAGCVSVPRSDMERILKWVSPEKHPVVIICLTSAAPIV